MNRAPRRRITSRIPHLPPMGRAVALLAGGTTAAQVIPLVASPFLTRLYTPSEYGLLAVFVSILVMVSSFDTLRYEMAIPVAGTHEDASHLTALVLLLLIAACAVALAVVGFFRQDIAWALNAPDLASLLWLLPISLAGLGCYQVLYFGAIRAKRFGVIARTRVTQSAAKVLVQLAGGVIGMGGLGLILGDVLGRSVGAGRLGAGSASLSAFRVFRTDLSALVPVAKRYHRFPMFSAPSGFLNTASLESVALLVTWAFSPAVAGQLNLTQRVVALPMVIVGMAVGEAYLGTGAELARRSPSLLGGVISSSAKRLLLVGILPAIIVVAAGPTIFAVVFGAGWAASGTYARIMAPAFLAQFVASPLSQTSNILNRQGSQLILDAARLAGVLSAFVLGRVAHLDPLGVVGLFSLFTTISYATMVLMYLRWAKTLSQKAAADDMTRATAARGDLGTSEAPVREHDRTDRR